MNGKTFLVLFFFILQVFLIPVKPDTDVDEEDYVDHHERFSAKHHRQKRQVLVGGGNVCSQTFLVPQTAVNCDLSPQVQEEMTTLKTDLQNQVTELENLRVKIDDLNPDKPRPLPEEVRQRLETIIRVRESQAGLQEALGRIDTNIGHLATRIDQIEASDRLEVARLIEQQTNLIKVTLHQSNMTLHDEYVDRLTENTRHLTDKLRELQDELNSKVETSERRLEETMQRVEDESERQMNEAKQELLTRAEQLEGKLSEETEVRQTFQVQTVGNKGELEKLFGLLTTLREHQALYEQDKDKLKLVIAELQEKLSAEKAANDQVTLQLQNITRSLHEARQQYLQLNEEIRNCHNRTAELGDSVRNLTKSVSDNAHLVPRFLKVSDCKDALQFFHPASGVYSVNPGLTGQPFDVFCDMENDQGWTVLLRRDTGKTEFYRGWQAYKSGFGELDDEHWLGLEKIHSLTHGKHYRLRVDLQDWTNKWWKAEYDSFFIDEESKAYALHVSGYQGDAGDALKYHDGMGFSTHDRNNDKNDGICARWCHGAWWYRDCFHSNLNGKYYNVGAYQSKTGWGDGVVWRTLKNTNFYSLKSVIMKIIPFN